MVMDQIQATQAGISDVGNRQIKRYYNETVLWMSSKFITAIFWIGDRATGIEACTAVMIVPHMSVRTSAGFAHAPHFRCEMLTSYLYVVVALSGRQPQARNADS